MRVSSGTACLPAAVPGSVVERCAGAEPLPIGVTCTYSCRPGYAPSPVFVTTLRCDGGGNGTASDWNDTLVACIGEQPETT